MIQDNAIVTVEGEYEAAPKVSNGTIFKDLERPQTQISRSGHSLTLSISEIANNMAIVTTDGE